MPPEPAFERQKLSSKWISSAYTNGYANSTQTPARTADSDVPELPFYASPGIVLQAPKVPYEQLSRNVDGAVIVEACDLLERTPLPNGAAAFSSMHIIAGPGSTTKSVAERLVESVSGLLAKESRSYVWPLTKGCADGKQEYEAIFKIGKELVLRGADRASLLVFVAEGGSKAEMAIATMIGMLPFRGVQTSFVFLSDEDGCANPLELLQTSSGLFEYEATKPERMGRPSLAAVFGPSHRAAFEEPLGEWQPLRVVPNKEEKPAPFKIGGLDLPMVTYEGNYDDGVARFAKLMVQHFGRGSGGLFPVVSVGETGDALGYGSDILAAMAEEGCPGHYFRHASGESMKHPEAFGCGKMLDAVLKAKTEGRRVVVVAVGGGVNGNAMGVVASMAGAEFIQVPTTLMHYNDATTSAKQAFSLVVDGQILSKNILGCFYVPKLVYCVSEAFLTLGTCSVHAAVGEAAKTMSMLGIADSEQGHTDFYNILGATEFASDFTRVVGTVVGFEALVAFLEKTQSLKSEAIAIGEELRELRRSGADADATEAAQTLEKQRLVVLTKIRATFASLTTEQRDSITLFLTTINEEVIKAKAMFLAYSDPFEKYRALLFEYAHTLGHGLEAFMNGLYRRAEACGIEYDDAFRLHGQCVGMAVTWAGEMSKELGHLVGDGYLAHQSLVYLFNRFGGFDFAPLRKLCDELDVSREEFCEGVLQVVRRDNKRGYCKCGEGQSVDQLVRCRPGKLVRSSDPSAELRYLVEIGEDAQKVVLEKAFDGEYDRVLLGSGDDTLSLGVRGDASKAATSSELACALTKLVRSLYQQDAMP